MNNAPLKDILVCDFTVALAGPSSTTGLARLGARVVKIERNQDPEREVPLILSRPGASPEIGFAAYQGGKQSITVDLKKPGGKDLIHRLIAQADVLVENFGHGTMERLGLDYESVRKLNSRLVYASIKGFDPGTPWERYTAFDPIIQAFVGATSITGHSDGLPLRPSPSLCDIGTGVALTAGILAALVQRESTGEGQRVFASLFDSAIHYLRSNFAGYVASGVAPVRNGNLDPDPSFKGYCEAFQCAGGGQNDYCVVELDSDDEWRSIVSVTQLTVLGEDPRFSAVALRYENSSALSEALAPWFLGRTKIEAMDQLLAGGVRAAAVLTPYDISRDASLRAEDTFEELVLSDGSSVKTLAWPVKFDHYTPPPTLGPGLGAHTDEVLRDLLGYGDEEIAELRERRAI